MALVLKDRVKETTTTTGTGSFALAGAVTGYDSFGQIGNGNTTYYAVYLDGGSEWEVGIGTYTAPSTLSRDTILASSNAGSVVTFSAGQKTIWCDYPAGKAVYTDATGSISQSIVNISGITGYISSPDYVQFDTNYATALGVGQLGWDGNNTLALGMAGGNVVQHIGEDQYFYIKASSAITKGQLIMFTGAVGASGVLTGAPSTGVTVPEYIMGVAAESIALNGFGLVQCFGELTNVNTNGFNEGDVLYYDSAVTGGLTNVYPSSGIIVTVAAVAKKSAGGGVLSIRLTETPRISASTGISVSQTNAGATITNTAPDQTVSLTAGTGISVSGTYPSFTIANTGVTSVSGTGSVNGITLTGTVTSSGSLTLGGTLGSIANSQLTNSSITINGTSIALGASGTITAANPNALTIGTGLTGTSYNGSAAVTIAIDSTVVVTSGSYANPSWITSLDGSKITGTMDGGSF